MIKVRTKALAISQKVKQEVLERDKTCILCGREGEPNAHYISRAQSGLGIKENIVTLCFDCHRKYDQTIARPLIKRTIKTYLDGFYPDFTDEMRRYKKYETTNKD